MGRFQWPLGLRRRSVAACWNCGFESHQGAMDVCCESRVLLGRGLCDGPITHSEESYRLWFVVVCDLETSWMWRPWPSVGGELLRQNNKQIVMETYILISNVFNNTLSKVPVQNVHVQSYGYQNHSSRVSLRQYAPNNQKDSFMRHNLELFSLGVFAGEYWS